MPFKEGSITSPEAEPTNQEWEILYNKVDELMKHYDDYKKIITSRPDKEDITTKHFSDTLNAIGFLSMFQHGSHADNMRTSDFYQQASRECLVAEKYFELLSQNPDFMQQELSVKGPAFPEMLHNLRTNSEKVKEAGFSSYQEAYIYGAEKELSKSKE